MKWRKARWVLWAGAVLGFGWLAFGQPERPVAPPVPAFEAQLATLSCAPETASAEVQTWLDQVWIDAKVAVERAGLKAAGKRGRPFVCLAPYPVILCHDIGPCGRLLGYYFPDKNGVLLMMTPAEATDERLRCVVLHEFGHAILGAGHKKVDKVFPRCE